MVLAICVSCSAIVEQATELSTAFDKQGQVPGYVNAVKIISDVLRAQLEKLAPSANIALPPADRRPLIPEPLPVKLVAIEDVHLPAAAGKEIELDNFYVHLWGFERDHVDPGLVYRAENFRLRFDVVEPPIQRQEMRAVQVEIPSLRQAEQKLIDAKIEYQRLKGLIAGSDCLLLLDPAGNWVALSEMKEIM